MAELRVKETGTIKLFESDNTSSVTIASPASLGADRTITLPDANVTLASGTMLATDGSGASLTALNASELGSGTVPAARLSGVGKILQVVESKFTTNTTTSSTSYVATGHIGTITPSATGSKILVQLSIGNANVDDSNRNLWISLYRDIAGAGYSEIIGGGDPWFRVRAEASTNNATGGGTNSFIDSPSTTSACNYQIYFKTDIGTLYYQNSGDNYGLNNMILMEIGA